MDVRTFAFRDDSPRPWPHRRLRVGVLVDLPIGPGSGGHVKCWERLAMAAVRFADTLDLTVHFAGASREVRPLGDNVRYAVERPVFSTARFGFLSHIPDHTDLAPWHPRIARALPGYDVIHTTDAYFAYARTALRIGRRRGIPMVNSVHTNTPEYTRIFAAQTIERLLGRGPAARLLLHRAGVTERLEQRMRNRLADYQERCAFALVSRPDQLPAVAARLGGRAGLLRRGIDHRFFHPTKRDRAWLAAAHGVPPERLAVFAVGRINRGKNVMLLVEALETLIARGLDVHLLCAGDGDLRPTVLQRLGPRATCPGSLDPEHVARLYACADIFALPSRVEEFANVALEALASGLPVLVAQESGMGRAIVDGETGLVLPTGDARPWAQAIAELAADAARRIGMGRAARRLAERQVPSWTDVLAEDLLPRWRQAAALRRLVA